MADAYRALFLEISKSMITSDIVDDIEKAKTIIKHRVGDQKYNKITTALELLHTLEEAELIRDDDVEYLRLLMVDIDRSDLAIEVEKYMKRDDVKLRKSARPSLREGPFVGRDNAKAHILRSINNEESGAKIVCISGFPGMGKTRLAKEICLEIGLQHHKPYETYFVELRGLTSIESIFFAIVNKLDGLVAKTYEPNILYDYLQRYDKGHAAIILDSVDKPLAPDSESRPNVFLRPFLDMLESFVKLDNPRVKFMITSRSSLNHKEFHYQDSCETILLEENDMTLDEAVQIIRHHAGHVDVSDDDARELALSCGKCPLALKVVARRLQDPHLNITPSEMIHGLQEKTKMSRGRTMKTLCHFGLARDERIDMCLTDTFDQLPQSDKRNITMLSVIPGTFTVKAAKHVLGYKGDKLIDIKYDLANLKNRNLIESDDESDVIGSSDLRSNLHLLLRTFIHEIKAENDQDVRKWCETAKQRYVRYYLNELQEISSRFDEDHTDAMRRKEDDSANFLHLIELLKDLSGLEEDVSDIRGTERIIQLLLSTKERHSYYKKRAEVAEREGNVRIHAEMKCRDVLQLLAMGHKVKTLMPILNQARFLLESLPDQESHDVQLSLATCYHCKGDVYYERGYHDKAEKWLLKALKIRQIHLGIHSETTRTYAALAAANLGLAFKDTEHTLPDGSITQSCVFQESKVHTALGYAEQALEMRKTITGSERHLEVPDIILNIAACYQILLEQDKAIGLYRKALDLEKKLQIHGFEGTQVILKNISMCYFEQMKYEDALRYATTAMDNRKRLLGDHPDTARSIFFVGNIYLNMKAYEKARLHMVDALNMEEKMVREGKALSADWRNLKTILPQVCSKLKRDRERSQYLRKFQEIEKFRDEHIPTIDEKLSSDERFSSSDDDDVITPAVEQDSKQISEGSKNSQHAPSQQSNQNSNKKNKDTIFKVLKRNSSESSSETVVDENEAHDQPLLPQECTGNRRTSLVTTCCIQLRRCCHCLPRCLRGRRQIGGTAQWLPLNEWDSDT